jgi:hypothetical protein
MHKNEPNCQGCLEKLKGVHPDLARWVSILRQTHPDAHVSCGYRGEADQNDAYRTGHSKALWGQSAHNVLPSHAVDLFRLTQANGAMFDRTWYVAVIAPIVRAAGLTYGGDFKALKDYPHVELPGWQPFKT